MTLDLETGTTGVISNGLLSSISSFSAASSNAPLFYNKPYHVSPLISFRTLYSFKYIQYQCCFSNPF